MSKVFIPNCAAHDYGDAERFGTLVPVTRGTLNITNVSAIYRKIESALCASCADDYILISGASVVNAIVAAKFATMHGKLNLLIYRRNGTYVERNLNFNQPE